VEIEASQKITVPGGKYRLLTRAAQKKFPSRDRQEAVGTVIS
jgi:hypothetical protein